MPIETGHVDTVVSYGGWHLADPATGAADAEAAANTGSFRQIKAERHPGRADDCSL
jgi:hypothetical protein